MLQIKDRVRLFAVAILIIALTALGTVWIAQLRFGVHPCHLCLEQRYAYYVVVPLSTVTIFAASYHAPRNLLTAAFIALALIMFANAALGTYHAGVEWKWWAGPRDCSGALPDLGSARDLATRINNTNIARCDVAVRPLFGISFAGYDTLVSMLLALVAVFGALTAQRDAAGNVFDHLHQSRRQSARSEC
jgi:disulfide bond formation protein DsbB